MGERPLHPEEIADLQFRLEEAKKMKKKYDKYVAALEEGLKRGTAWTWSRWEKKGE